jgi:hypothetical protein
MASEIGMEPEITENEYMPGKKIRVYQNYHEILKVWQDSNPGKPMPLASEPAYLCLDNAEDIQEVW